jgi:4-hydroxythreonine-4-phosphate dehydrogenase
MRPHRYWTLNQAQPGKQGEKPMMPRIALLLGDPAGIGPELVAKLLADPASKEAEITVVGDRRELEAGMEIAGLRTDVGDTAAPGRSRLVDHRGAGGWQRGVASAESGQYIFETLRIALELARKGEVDALCFAPLNKTSLHLAGMTHEDELRWFAAELGFHGPTSELNVLDELWTSRVTSHVPHMDVAALLTPEKVAGAITLLAAALQAAGKQHPRIAVAGLNPHAGDNGNFGREEIDIIAPGIAQAKSDSYALSGPYPADTVFVRASKGEFDAVVTMYHDQGQIAMKLMGFDRGVTVAGGLPLPVTTPAHGTAFDIVGQNRANVGATRNAFLIACRMGAQKAKTRQAA